MWMHFHSSISAFLYPEYTSVWPESSSSILGPVRRLGAGPKEFLVYTSLSRCGGPSGKSLQVTAVGPLLSSIYTGEIQ